jgi:hypothetical protein
LLIDFGRDAIPAPSTGIDMHTHQSQDENIQEILQRSNNYFRSEYRQPATGRIRTVELELSKATVTVTEQIPWVRASHKKTIALPKGTQPPNIVSDPALQPLSGETLQEARCTFKNAKRAYITVLYSNQSTGETRLLNMTIDPSTSERRLVTERRPMLATPVITNVLLPPHPQRNQ